MSEITITEIHRYPVKSMLGETPSEVTVSERGIHGDRAWATRDEVRLSLIHISEPTRR